MRERLRYAVTFELPESLPPLTVRGTITAGSPQAAVRLAVVDAKRQVKGRRWSSLVVLLEREAPPDRLGKSPKGPSKALNATEV